MTEDANTVRSQYLVEVADLRSGLFHACSASSLELRLNHLCNSLLLWTNLPQRAHLFYGRDILRCIFRMVEDFEDDASLDETHRAVIELSLWQAVTDLGLQQIDGSRAHFIARRQTRLHKRLESEATSPILRLVYGWSSLLRPRTEKIRELPGPYREDLSAVITELVNAGLPRRAKALAARFQLSVDPLIRWSIEHRREEDEIARTRTLLDRIASPPQPVPYAIRVSSRALIQVLSAPLGALPVSVSSVGITIHKASAATTNRSK